MELPQFSVRSVREGHVHNLTPVGELDIATVQTLEAVFDAVCAEQDDVHVILLDLGELSFIDSSGLHLLLRMNERCADAGRLRVLVGSAPVERLLDIAGARERLPIIGADADPLAPLPADR